VRLPTAEPHSRSTALFERFAIDALNESDVTGDADLGSVHCPSAPLLE
jgi:hypothetical protein